LRNNSCVIDSERRALFFFLRGTYPVACDVSVIPAKLVSDPDRGAGIWIPDKPCGLSGMTPEGYPVACGGVVHSMKEMSSLEILTGPVFSGALISMESDARFFQIFVAVILPTICRMVR